MKKILIITLLGFAMLQAFILGGNNEIKYAHAPSNPKHTLPTSSNEILSFHQVLKDSIDAVVNISIRIYSKQRYIVRDPFFGYEYYQHVPQERLKRALGSGVILSKDGYIVTNNHVIAGADEITVSINGHTKEYPAKLIGSDKGSDLAVIKIEAEGLKPISLSKDEDVHVGDVVFAIGNPFGVGETVTQGIVSALNKQGMGINQYENFIQTDASINPGNSGGALVDSRGALIGINAAILSRSGGNHGVGFSIPVDMVQNIVTKLVKNGKVDRGYLGVSIAPITTKNEAYFVQKEGAIITQIQRGSAADIANLQPGDLIYEVEGKKVSSPTQLQQIIANISPNTQIDVTLEREKKEVKTTMKLHRRME
ncbi:MAG: HtrA protease/chaperone protein / Serine protease (Protease DO) (EC [uncultured Sulfurovum sp.]|uniref:HtrA protease/chaperone protein / Serine protease (Protease DO) (EC) n=1 Tax=uncultured Sulfurovum sp. TaxID=269237 RepID=A0A6S6UEG5_9BACT|nr:MAG: HtrA protease/chaperone protein / Serine protease (Protease DO) (EC [uncultured Sulfurovum sp.]